MISEKAFVIESSRSHCPCSNNLDRLKVNPSDIPSTGSPDVIQSRGGCDGIVVNPPPHWLYIAFSLLSRSWVQILHLHSVGPLLL